MDLPAADAVLLESDVDRMAQANHEPDASVARQQEAACATFDLVSRVTGRAASPWTRGPHCGMRCATGCI
jgi:hypothetical protein